MRWRVRNGRGCFPGRRLCGRRGGRGSGGSRRRDCRRGLDRSRRWLRLKDMRYRQGKSLYGFWVVTQLKIEDSVYGVGNDELRSGELERHVRVVFECR